MTRKVVNLAETRGSSTAKRRYANDMLVERKVENDAVRDNKQLTMILGRLLGLSSGLSEGVDEGALDGIELGLSEGVELQD